MREASGKEAHVSHGGNVLFPFPQKYSTVSYGAFTVPSAAGSWFKSQQSSPSAVSQLRK